MLCLCLYPDCAIFRCGICKDKNEICYGKQIEPHLPKEECDGLKKEDKIWDVVDHFN